MLQDRREQCLRIGMQRILEYIFSIPVFHQKGDRRDSGRDEGSTEGSLTGKNTREEMPFTWQERVRYIFMALGAAFLIGAVLLGGVAAVIWLITLYD